MSTTQAESKWQILQQSYELKALITATREEFLRVIQDITPHSSPMATFTLAAWHEKILLLMAQDYQKVTDNSRKEWHHNYGAALYPGKVVFGPIYSSIILPIGFQGSPVIHVDGTLIDNLEDGYIYISEGKVDISISGSGKLGVIVVAFEK